MRRLSLPFWILLFLCAWAQFASIQAASVEIIPTDLHGATQPQVAVAPSGKVHVTFGRGTSIFHTSSPDGVAFAAPTKVGELAKLALGLRRGPRITATDDRVTIVAISGADGNLHGWTSADSGASWQKTPPLNDVPGSAQEGLHALAGDGKGQVIATWLDLRHDTTELWRALSRDGGATWQLNTQVYRSRDGHICECCHPCAAINEHGQAVVMWRNWLDGSRDLYLARSEDGGRTFGPGEKLGGGTWQLNGCPMDGGSMVLQADGTVSTIWRRDHTLFTTTGSNLEERKIADGTQPVLVGQGAKRYLLWQGSQGLMAQKAEGEAAILSPAGRFAAAAPLAGDRALVVYEANAGEDSTIYAEILP